MRIETILATKETSNIIKNMYPLYLYDLSEIYNEFPNEYGIFEEEPIKTLEEQYDIQNNWFEKPDFLFPYIIKVDGKPAGFIMISTKIYTPQTTDYYVYETFVLRSYRGLGIAETAVGQVFDRYHGRWELYTRNINNVRGQSFWRKTLRNYTGGNYEESQGTTFIDDEEKMIFRFKN